MKYRFENRVGALDFWVLSLHHTYRSTVGVVNIVFTAAMFALTYRFWGKTNDILEVLMVLGCILFPVLQPFFVYLRSKAQASLLPQNLELEFDDWGLRVKVGEQTQDLPWNKIVSATKEYNMIVVRSDAKHGYIISNRMLGKQREEFWAFLESKIKTKK